MTDEQRMDILMPVVYADNTTPVLPSSGRMDATAEIERLRAENAKLRARVAELEAIKDWVDPYLLELEQVEAWSKQVYWWLDHDRPKYNELLVKAPERCRTWE